MHGLWCQVDPSVTHGVRCQVDPRLTHGLGCQVDSRLTHGVGCQVDRRLTDGLVCQVDSRLTNGLGCQVHGRRSVGDGEGGRVPPCLLDAYRLRPKRRIPALCLTYSHLSEDKFLCQNVGLGSSTQHGRRSVGDEGTTSPRFSA